jgi:hypothetical protein
MKNAVFWNIKLIGNTLFLRYRAQPVNDMYDLRFLQRRRERMLCSLVWKPNSYLAGNTLRLHHKALPINNM